MKFVRHDLYRCKTSRYTLADVKATILQWTAIYHTSQTHLHPQNQMPFPIFLPFSLSLNLCPKAVNPHLLFFVMCQVSRLQYQTYRHLDSVGHYNTKLLKAQNIDSHIISYAYFFWLKYFSNSRRMNIPPILKDCSITTRCSLNSFWLLENRNASFSSISTNLLNSSAHTKS